MLRTPFILTIAGIGLGLIVAVVLAWTNPTLAPPSGNAPAPINVSNVTQTKAGGLDLATVSGSVGIGTVSPSSLLSVGPSSQFQVNGSGNVVRINNIPYTWPGAQGGVNTGLRNDGAGNLSWQAQAPEAERPPILFSRGLGLVSSLVDKQAKCTGEFGADYSVADVREIAVYARLGIFTPVGSRQFATTDSSAYFQLVNNLGGGYNYITTTSGSANYKVACVWNKAPIRFTGSVIALASSIAAKNTFCATSFGTEYQAATPQDVAAHAHMGFSGNALAFNTTDTTRSYQLRAASGFSYIDVATNADRQLACIRIR